MSYTPRVGGNKRGRDKNHHCMNEREPLTPLPNNPKQQHPNTKEKDRMGNWLTDRKRRREGSDVRKGRD